MQSTSIFNDIRLDKEFDALTTQMSTKGTSVINRACPVPADKKSAYRFLNNEKVTVERIAEDLVRQTVDNVTKLGVKEVLVAQDTMEVVRENVLSRMKKSGREILECARGYKGMRSHSAIVMDAEGGMPLGFGYLKIWGRKPASPPEVDGEGNMIDRRRKSSYYITDQDTGEKRYRYNIPVEERDSESARWLEASKKIREALPGDVHIIMVQDREGDMYPVLNLSSQLINLDIVVRASKKRKVLLPDGRAENIFDYTASGPVMDRAEVSVGKGPRKKARKAAVEIRFGQITVRRPHIPVYPQKTVSLYFVRVTETAQSSKGQASPVDWLLLTTLEVKDISQARNIILYYRRRWFIEDYHRLLKKKGFGIEDIQVESPHAFEVNLAVCIRSAYETALVKKGFDSGDDTAPATLVFTPLELEIVGNLNKQFNPEKKIYKNPFQKGSLAWAAWVVAREGGWSAMPSQPKPGLITFKRGIDRIETIYEYLLRHPQGICG